VGKKSRRKNAPTRYWHGGWPGLAVSTVLKGPAELGIVMPNHLIDGDPTDPTWLYITTDRSLAKGFAAQWRHQSTGPLVTGDLYRVEPIGDITEDPDYPSGVGQRCRAARIVAVEQRAVRLTPALQIAFYRHNTWDDGTPMYDAAGHILPCRAMLEAGVTADDLRTLGVLPDAMRANALATRIARVRQGA